MIAVLFYKLGAFLTHLLPDRITTRIAATLGFIQYYMRIRTRRNLARNLRVILEPGTPAATIRRITRATFVNFAECVRLFLKLPRIDPQEFARRIDATMFDRVLEKLEPGKGFIIVSAHLGPWELGGIYMKHKKIRMHTVALDHPTRQATRFFNERRIYASTVCYPLEGSFPALKKALEAGECVVLLIDRDYKTTNNRCTFFGLPVSLPNSHLLLAARCRVPLVPGAFLLQPDAGFKGIFRGPYHIADYADRLAAMEEVQQRCLADLEDLIREYPDQYFHFEPLQEHYESH